MKKMILFLVLLMAIPLVIFAQDPTPPTGWGDVIMNPAKWFVDIGAVAVLTAFLAAFFNGFLAITKKFPRQLIAWAIAIILLVVSDLINFGYAAEFPILLAIMHGFGAGLISNGVFNVPVVKGILTAIEGWFPKKE